MGLLEYVALLTMILDSFSNLNYSLSFWLGVMLLLPGYSGKYTHVCS